MLNPATAPPARQFRATGSQGAAILAFAQHMLRSSRHRQRTVSAPDPQDSESTLPRVYQPAPIAPGLMIAGRYRIQRLIARGGMSTVYLAEQMPLQRPVALKIVTPPADAEGTGEFNARFRLEAETLAALQHPNIVTLYDYGVDEYGRYFLAMEYIDAPRYLDLLNEGTMSVERSVNLLLQVCAALKHAHKLGVIHRDLKPSNLLVGTDGEGHDRVRVVDFGLVKVLEGDQGVTRTGLVMGSPHCMAPEQVRGIAVDARTDIYALGVLLFRSLTGQYPFHGESPTATMLAHLHATMPRIADVAPEAKVPWPVERVVYRALQRNPDDRFRDVDELMAALVSAMNEESAGRTLPSLSLDASTPSPAPAVVKPRGNLPWIAAILVILLLGLGGGIWFWPKTTEPVEPVPVAPVAEPKPEPVVEPAPPPEQPKPEDAKDEPKPKPVAKPPVKPTTPPKKKDDAKKPPDGYMPLPDDLK